MSPNECSELTLSLVANHALNTIYDVFVFSNSGVLTMVTGPAWSASTAGSGARGSGAGTTQLTRVKGLWTNAVSMTGRNGSTTYTVGANLGTYVGSILIDGTAGQVTCHATYGQSRKWGVWNAYNRSSVTLKVGDATAGWTIGGGGSSALQSLRGQTTNSMTTFVGLPEQTYDFHSYMRASFIGTTNQNAQFYTAIGFNSTSSASGIIGTYGISFGAGVSGNFTFVDSATGRANTVSGSIGINTITHLEGYAVTGAAAPTVVTGSEASNLLTGTWLA